MFTQIYPPFTPFSHVYPCLSTFQPVYPCLPRFIHVLPRLLVFTQVYPLFTPFTRVCPSLSMFYPVYACLPKFIHVLPRLSMFTPVYPRFNPLSIRVDSCSSFIQLQRPLKPGPNFQNNLLITARFFSDLSKSQSLESNNWSVSRVDYRGDLILMGAYRVTNSDDVRNKKSTFCYQLCFWWYCYLDE